MLVSSTDIVQYNLTHAGWAQLMDTEMKGWSSLGVVAAIVPWNFPLMLLCWKVAIVTTNT